MTDPKSREGTMFGHYRLLRLIGKGGMGEVYEAEDTQKDRIVALKLLPESVSHDPVFRARLQREAHSAGRLQEPHVVPIHDYGEIDGVLFVDMRMINGSDLRKLLRDFGPMPPARAVAIVRQVASAIDAAHENGLVHRDVKPENILITRDDFAYLVDFGIANAKSDEKLTELGTAVGTYAYMAPERFSGEEVTSRADVYALACVLYECLAGSPPYAGDSVSVVITAHLMQPIPRPSLQRPGIPPAFDQVIARGMAKKAAERFATAGDLAAAATDALTPPEQDQAATIVRRGEAAAAAPSGPTPGQGPTMAAPIPPPPPAYLPGYGTVPPSYPTMPPPGPMGAPQGPMGAPPGYPPPPPYGYPGGPPPPGSGPQTLGGKKTPWVPIIVVLAVLILALGAIGTFVLTRSDDAAGPTPTTSTRASTARERPSTSRTTAPRTTDTGPSGFDAQLMALIPSSYPTSACEKAIPPAPGALATVDCRESAQPGGPAAARYSLFPNANSLSQQFQSAIAENEELLRCPGADADSPITWHYQATPDAVAGSVACGTYQGNADIVWTQDDDLLLADVQSADMDALHDWWLNYS
ncbi:serine/threonine protein kinase [Mycobacterium yunnanensis]|uniref:non-specific serine/threonine protein kinase n=1 Tax=Mycobacterium yunnanensis TaxID=368477 RepID=A0A9X2Z3Z9_9MYCO|nr:serine/threonine-protein kinase [Mycobacterium yunnanensis]MCV7422699.1 serine/threonine protein kinase [Mycobacterium yunnanensis]